MQSHLSVSVNWQTLLSNCIQLHSIYFILISDYDLENYTTTDGDDYLVTPCFESDEESSPLQLLASCQTVFYTLVFLLGVPGNFLVVATFARYWRARLRSLTDTFLLHLALSDLQLLLMLPLQVGEALRREWPFGDAICRVSRGLQSVNTYSSLLLLACISAERYSVVVLRSGATRRGKTSSGGCCHRRLLLQAGAACLSVALVAIALSIPDFLFSQVDPSSGMCGLNVWVEDPSRVKLALSGSMIAGFCVPFAIMAVCYTAIGCVLAQGQGWRRQRTLRLMVALVLLFLVFQLPYTLVLGLKLSGTWQSCALLLWESGTSSLAYTHCCLNPVLYALVGVRFRNDVLRLLHEAGCCVCLSVSRLTLDPDSGSSISRSSAPPTTTLLSPKSPPPRMTKDDLSTHNHFF